MFLSAFLDYAVIDHLLKIDDGRYKGAHRGALDELRRLASDGKLDVWMSEITRVEMLHGQKNPKLTQERRAYVTENDSRKLRIAEAMGVRWLAYPCSKMDDDYSLMGVSFRFAGPTWAVADSLEKELAGWDGVSAGDARQLVSWVFGWEDHAATLKPEIPFFVSEDRDLQKGLGKYLQQTGNDFLKRASILSVRELIDIAHERLR